jgi:hypothetical protein
MEKQVNNYLGSAKGAGDNSARYDTMLKIIEDKSGVTQADITNYVKAGISGVVDKYYSKTGNFDINPAKVYSMWQQKGICDGQDGLQTVKDTLSAFYLNPTPANYSAVVAIMASYNKLDNQGDQFAGVAGVAFSKALEELSDPLWNAVVNDGRSPATAIAAAGNAGKNLGIFSVPYAIGSK